MSRKTNKTTHVLNLLSNGVKKPEDGVTEESTEKAKQEKEIRAEKQAEEKSSEKIPGVSVVRRGSGFVADAIKASLEEELRTEEEQRTQEAKCAEEAKESEKEQENVVNPPSCAFPKGQEEGRETRSGHTDAPDAARAEADSGPEDDFVTVNVMERLVKERAPRYIRQFHLCGCSRCLADVTALALTGLPPKYVVINKNAMSPLMNFYTVKYAGLVAVEVTKACMTVQANPHHSAEKSEFLEKP